MKTIRFAPQLIAAIIAGFLPAQIIQAAPNIWNNADGGNWSVAGNWSTSATPGTGDDVQFGDIGAGLPNMDDALFSINSLTYNQDNQVQQMTIINPGQTLTINSSVAAGTELLSVGSTVGATASTLTSAAIQGPGGALTLNGAGDLVVRQGNTAAGSHMATLDLSGLDTLNATIGRLLVGQATTGNAVNRPSGTLILAATNNITLTGASPQVMLQDSGSNANGGTASVLTFGEQNNLFADVMRLGGQKGNATINFNTIYAYPPSLVIRNSDGVSPVSAIDFGYNGAVTSGNSTAMTADFSAGTVDLSANLVNIAQGNPGPGTGTCVGTVTIGAGIFNVNDLEIGWGNATGANGGVTAILNVNNNFLFSTGAVVVANSMLRLARTNGGTGVINGTLNLNGGTVIANTIVSGGGVSAINAGYGSTLVISNTAGTLAAPIGTLSLSDATLDIPLLNSGGVVAVKTLFLGGSANTINITSIPGIGAYPATFTLISYQDGYTAGTGPISLGPLPTGYNGTLVDAGGGVIQLQLTSGPITDLTLYWTGATDNNWDSYSPNWLFEGNASAFFAGGAVLFDDTTAQSSISINEPVSPSSITFSNSVLPYTFTGAGNIAGASTLTKTGAASLTLDNSGVNNIGAVTISEGTLQLGMEDENGGLSAVSIANNGALVIDRTDNLTLSSAISGSGTLTKNGAGTLILSGANSYSGATTVNAGALEIDGTSSGVGAVTTSADTVLAGSGTVSGAVTVGGQLNPGTAAAPGTFNANGGLTLNSGSTLNFDLNAADASNPALNDSVNVMGDLHLSNNTITANFNGTPQPGASYLLFTYTGTLSGSFNPTILGTHFTATVDTSAQGYVYLTITGGAGSALEWSSLYDSTWDSITTNWTDLSSGQPSVFYAGDSVLLDDSNGVLPLIILAAGVNVAPSLITNDSTNNYFTISGAGSISGGASIVKAGPSTLTISTANSFSGTVDVQGGTLQTGNGAALGNTTGGTTVEPGATLDLNGQILGGEVITISSNGVNGAGALVNNGAGQAQAIRQIVLAGDATIGGTGLLGINNGGGAASLSTGGQPFSLTKVGANQLTLQNFTTVDAALGNIDIQQGTIEFSGLTASMGDPTYTNTVEAGATLSLSQNTVAWNKQFVFNGDGSTTTLNIGTSANAELDGPVVLHGDCVFNVGGTILTFANTISGDGGVIKNGGSPMIFTMPCTYTGDTVLNSAALRLNAGADISTSPNITVSSGSTLTVTGLVNSTFTLASGQTLKGGGVVNGGLITSAGSTLSPGVSGIGMLTVSNVVTLSGTTIMELDPDNATNDVLKSGVSIVFGGTLNLVNLGSSLSGGSSFKLFNAPNYTGSFTINPSTPGPGQTWDTSELATTGTIKVVGGSSGPLFGGTVVSDGNVIVSGSGGVPFGDYYVLATTNVALPLASWTAIATNQFDASGNFTFTNSLDSSVAQQFFQIELP